MIPQANGGGRHGRRGRRRVRHVRLGSLLRLRVRLFRLVGIVARCLEERHCCPRGWSSSASSSLPSPATSARAQQQSQAGRCPVPAAAAAAAAVARRESTTSFQADAIADCLEFIKRSYLQPVQQQQQQQDGHGAAP